MSDDLVKVCESSKVSLDESSLSKEKFGDKIFLVKTYNEHFKVDEDMGERKIELSPQEFSHIKLMVNDKNCSVCENLLKKLESLDAGE